MSDPVAWEFAKTLLGTFTGAILAFVATRLHDMRKKRQENIVAGHLALFTVQSQLDAFLVFRLSFYEDVADPSRTKNGPLWGLIRPTMQTYLDYKIDFKSLGFLFEKGEHATLLIKLSRCQKGYEDLVETEEFRNRNVIELHRELSKLQRDKPLNTTEQDEVDIGPFLLESVHSAVLGLAERATRDEVIYTEAHDQLHSALESELNNSRVKKLGKPLIGFFWNEKPIFLPRRIAVKKYREESLPALPDAIRRRLPKR